MKKALVVGINNYKHSPLKGCINDAREFANEIKENGDESPNFEVVLATNVMKKAKLKSLIIELFEGDNDIALFYFSGHGYIDNVGGYLVTPDSRINDVGVSMDEVLSIANNSKAKNKVLILDCCHSGAFGSPTISGGAFAQINEGVTILTASRKNESAIEINGHGVFTNLLLNALNGGAADIQGHITPGGIYAYIDQALGAWHKQRPLFKTNVSQFTVLKSIPAQVSKTELRRIVKYFPSPEYEYKLNPSYEFTNSTEVEHLVIKPFAKPDHVAIFKDLQKFESVGLVVPVNAEHMYFAAMNSKSCKLTALGYHYWRLVQVRRL